MNRRTVLTIAGVAGGIAALSSVGLLSADFESAVARVLKRHLGFLKLDREGLHKFAVDFAQTQGDRYKMAVVAYSFLDIKPTQSEKIRYLISQYLLSTDFFPNKMNEAREVKYIGLYDPYRRPCAHPFAQFER